MIVGVDPGPGRLDALRTWTREYHDALHPFSAGGGYVNMLMDDEGDDRVEAAYADDSRGWSRPSGGTIQRTSGT